MKTSMELLTENLEYRKRTLLDQKGEKVDRRNGAHPRHDADSRWLIELTYGHVLTAIERRSTLANIVKSMGTTVMRRMKLEEDAVQAVHIGWHILMSYLDLQILSYKGEKRRNPKTGKWDKHPTYYLVVNNIEAIEELMMLIETDDVALFPSKIAPEPWLYNKFVHKQTGIGLIKHAHEDAIQAVRHNDMNYLTDTLNKLGATGWRINPFVFDVFNKTKTTKGRNPFKFSKEVDRIKRASLIVEANAIGALAERNKDNAFYHLYNVDFRGRIYPNTAFLHEQSSDNAKGLLLLDEAVPLGEEGYYWLAMHSANMWGNDKVSLDDRVQWVQDNFDKLMSYVEDPLNNDEWMDADKPFCFLACCYELALIQQWVIDGNEQDNFPSCLPIYIDGSNNGVQHLTAMSKDETVAPLVNLVPMDVPGDVYMYIAEHTLTRIGELLKKCKQKDIERFDEFFKEFQLLEKTLRDAPERSEQSKEAWGEKKKFGNHNYDYIGAATPIYWSKITNKKVWRKTLKRNVMTLAYGGTPRGMGQQIIDDTRGLSDYHRDMHEAWGLELGRIVHGLCYEKLPGAAGMLRMFEALAQQENDKDVPIAYTQIVTGFPFVHSYRDPEKKRVLLAPWGDERLKVNIQIWKEATLKKSKQKTGASPNIVHSLDAVHLTMCVHDADYPVTVVHDSFGSHAGNMGHLFKHVREKFVELYELDPLKHILTQMDAEHLTPVKGTLNVSDVMLSDFAFA